MRLVVVSNRVALPGPSEGADGPPVGGLGVALREALERTGGVWLGWSGQVGVATSLAPPPPRLVERGRVTYALLDLSPDDEREYYSGFANRALWPLMHERPDLVAFSRADRAGYGRVNRRFAGALRSLLRPGDLIWVHDYHLIPLGAELRALGVGQPIGYFHHVPWPGPDAMGALPGAESLREALRAYDLIGVQTARDAGNLGAWFEAEAGGGRAPRLAVLPVGIDAKAFAGAAERSAATGAGREARARLRGRQVVLGVDRLDYSKGVEPRVEAFERFLLANPDRRGSAVLVQVAPPSRAGVPEYAGLARSVETAVGRVNGALGDPGWTPIHYVARALPRADLAGLMRLARVGLVTPLRDGMNLVAKEYAAAQDPEDPGVLVLSRFAGAADGMPGAILVNPHDRYAVSEAIRDALDMGAGERRARWRSMRDALSGSDAAWWAGALLRELAATPAGAGRPVEAGGADLRARDSGARDLGARDLGARDLGARETARVA